jgi:hypothetical protein
MYFNSSESPNTKMTVPQALRRYWVNLLGVALFPSACFIGIEVYRVSFWVFLPFFFLVCGLAGWPYLTRRAPYAFWLVACGIWMAGVMLGGLLLEIIKALKA